MHLIIVVKWELFRKYHIKQCVFRDDVSKTKNILSFHTVWVETSQSDQLFEGQLCGEGLNRYRGKGSHQLDYQYPACFL